MYYDGAKWNSEGGNLVADEYAKELHKALLTYAIEDNFNQEFYNSVTKYANRPRREAGIKDAMSSNAVLQSEYDTNPRLLNCLNGTFNLGTMKLQDHNPDDMLTKVAGFKYLEEARCERFEDFISEVMNNDDEMVDFLQRVIGYSLLGDPKEEKLYLFHGNTTRNGKSTLVHCLTKMFGDYAVTTDPAVFLRNKNKNGDSASPQVSRWAGIRAVFSSEFEKGRFIDENFIKGLTGRDSISTRNLYKDVFEFVPQFVLFINTNNLPLVSDQTIFQSNRVQVISFDRHFDESEQDKDLKAKLTTPESLSGIFNWCLDGVRKYRKYGVEPPQKVRNAIESFSKLTDKILAFFDNCMIYESGAKVKGSDVYNRYKDWCNSISASADSKEDFFNSCRDRGLMSPSNKNVKVDGESVRNAVLDYKVK